MLQFPKCKYQFYGHQKNKTKQTNKNQKVNKCRFLTLYLKC